MKSFSSRHLKLLLSALLSFLLTINGPAFAAHWNIPERGPVNSTSNRTPLRLRHLPLQRGGQTFTPETITETPGSPYEGEPSGRGLQHLALTTDQSPLASQSWSEQNSKPPELRAWGPTQSLSPSPTTIAQSSSSLLQEGIRHYQSAQYSAAITSWIQALNTTTEPLTQALLLSNLSLAHQRLSQWPQANQTIAQSLDLLATPIATSAYTETLAKALNTQGSLHWATGDIETALATWREATAAYRQSGNTRGTLLSLINQAKAMQALGQHLPSKMILEEQVSPIVNDPSLEPALQATGLWQLGNAQRQFGDLVEAEKTLQSSLNIIQKQQLSNLQAPVMLDLANTELALGDKKQAIGKKKEAQEHQQYALEIYEVLATQADTPTTQLQANLNRLSVLIDTQQWAEANALWPEVMPALEKASPNRTGIYAQLNFAYSLMELMAAKREQANEQNSERSINLASAAQRFPLRRGTNGGVIDNLRNVSRPLPDGSPSQGEPEEVEQKFYSNLPWQKSTTEQPQTVALGQSPTTKTIDTIILSAIQQSRTIADPIAESYGIGQRGKLYELTQDYETAQAFTRKALQLTEQMSFSDGRYRWEWQQGRLSNLQGQRQDAILAYGNAVKTLKEIRSNLLFIDAEVQFSFRDNVEPVYRELVELLLSQEELDEPTLDLAVQQIDNLQLSELENFLRCDLTGTTTITQFEVDANTAVLHPIILKNRLGVISQFQDKKEFTDFDIPSSEVEMAVERLRKDLSLAPDRTPEVRETAQMLHQWLIEPIEAELQRRDIKTLVFVLDGSLRNIPMAVLFDGEQYLVEKYAIAVAPELELFTPTPLTPDLKVFTGGVGTPQKIGDRSFAPIEKLDAELDVISELFGTQPPVTNENFNGRTLKDQLSTGNFSGIHIKTHGLFSSDPEETFIVGYDELIKGEALGNLIQSGSRQGVTPVELLVLSACSTATGDSRAILGLAGIAVRAGARSTLSTLWEAEDTPNTLLMIRFYQELKKPNITRAEALRNAQLALINEEGYKAPHRWATYVLVGNWR